MLIFENKSDYYTDMKRVLFVLWQCTWGILQTLCGLVVFLWHIGEKHYWYHNAICTEWNRNTGVSLGLFIFVWPNDKKCVMHEYGHSIQSLFLGPLYLLVIGIPSFVWCNFMGGYRRRHRLMYSEFYPERSADYLGEKVVKERLL